MTGIWELPGVGKTGAEAGVHLSAQGAQSLASRTSASATFSKTGGEQQIFRQLVKCFNLQNIRMISGKLVNKDIKAQGT